MYGSVAVVTALSLALTCATAVKSAARVPLPPSNPLKSNEQEKQQKSTPAMALFSQKQLPSLGRAMAIGYYSMQFLERFAPLAAQATGRKGILIGDMAQPRGGPLPFGHKSHQIGLDVDIWFMPMPDRVLSAEEREDISAPNMVAADGKHINDKIWSSADIAFIRTAAEQPEVERVLVNAAIKKELCRDKSTKDQPWMSKVRPWYGHADHIHVRLKCPADSPDCRAQPAVPTGNGCNKSLNHWFADWILRLKIPDVSPSPSAKGLTLKDLPPACASVLNAPASPGSAATDERLRPR